MRKYISLLMLLCVLPFGIQAQIGFQPQIENAIVFKVSTQPKGPYHVGQEITLEFEALIEPGFHIYSATPPKDWPNLGTTLEWDEAPEGVTLVGKLDEKGGKAETSYDDIFETDITIYHDKVTFFQKVKIDAENPTLTGFLRYQVCDDSRCVPGSFDFSESLKTEKKKGVTSPEASLPASPPAVSQNSFSPELGSATSSTDDLLAAATWSVSWEGEAKAGATLRLVLKAEIDPDHYIYSTAIPEAPANLPTKWVLDPETSGIELVGTLQEVGDLISKEDEVFETTVKYYKKEVSFEQAVKLVGENPRIEGYLAYQICNEGACANGKYEVAKTWEVAAAEGGSTQASIAKTAPAGGQSLGLLFIKGFLFGLASLLTPCIFPMIPLTVSFFTKQSDNAGKGVRNAIFYGVSIVFIYTILGLLVSVLVGGDAMRQLAVNPWANLFFFAVIFAFALSFLGMFEITLPGSWSTAVKKESGRGGLVGIFLMALALAIVSFSCTGPLVSTALLEAANGTSFLAPTITMLAFSSAIAIPFALFAVFPGWMNSLPRSGGWLNSVKVSLGFLELALSLIYLSRADLVLGWDLLSREVFIGAWIVIFVLLGVYLLGKIQLPHDSKVDQLSVPRLLLAISSFWFAFYLLPGLWGAPLSSLGGYLPEASSLPAMASIGIGATPVASDDPVCDFPNKISEHLAKDTPQGFCAFYDLEQGLAYAKQVNKPVFIDFTGHTCANCRYLEKNAWIDPELRKLISEKYVLVSLYTDDGQKLPSPVITPQGKKLRTVGDQWIQYQIDTYQSNAQPLYVLIDHNKQSLLPPTGFDPPLDIDFYRDYFQQGLQAFKGAQASR